MAYRGGAPAITDLIAGQVHMMIESLSSIAPFAKSGEVRPLGVTGARRSPALPDVPTVSEAGLPGFEATTWSGVIGPAGMPSAVVERLNAAINRAIGTKAFEERLASVGQEVAGGSPEEFARTIREDSAKWLDVIKRAGVKLEP